MKDVLTAGVVLACAVFICLLLAGILLALKLKHRHNKVRTVRVTEPVCKDAPPLADKFPLPPPRFPRLQLNKADDPERPSQLTGKVTL